MEEERRRLEEAITNQARTAEEGQEQYERWRESHMSSLREAQALVQALNDAQAQVQAQARDENATRAAVLEREKETCRSELSEGNRKLTDLQARLDASEQDLCRVRYLLSESQTSINWMKQEKERGEQEGQALQHRLQDDIKQMSSALENALRNEATLTQKLEEVTSRHLQDRQNLDKELDELRRAGDHQVTEREQRIERLRVECEARLRGLESRHTLEIEREHGRAETALRENEQLRRFLADHRKSSSLGAPLVLGMGTLQAQLEGHILRLQRHTEELRGDLGRSSRAVSPVGHGGGGGEGGNSSTQFASPQRPREGSSQIPGTGFFAPPPLIGGCGGGGGNILATLERLQEPPPFGTSALSSPHALHDGGAVSSWWGASPSSPPHSFGGGVGRPDHPDLRR